VFHFDLRAEAQPLAAVAATALGERAVPDTHFVRTGASTGSTACSRRWNPNVVHGSQLPCEIHGAKPAGRRREAASSNSRERRGSPGLTASSKLLTACAAKDCLSQATFVPARLLPSMCSRVSTNSLLRLLYAYLTLLSSA
jgi:hypothetical protein